jgi:hypothetical protein
MKFFKHLWVVIKHKSNVLYYASKLGIFWTGLVHDLTKFTPTEFNRSVKYFHGKKSPTIVERASHDNFSYICVAHTGRNKHHWQYWVDYTRWEIVVNKIPYRHALEYVADVLSASKVYNPKGFNFMVAHDYFKEHSKTYLMHPATKEFILWCIKEAHDNGFKAVKKKISKAKYIEISNKYTPTIIVPITNIGMENFEIK